MSAPMAAEPTGTGALMAIQPIGAAARVRARVNAPFPPGPIGGADRERAGRTGRRWDGPTAGGELAQRLREAWVDAGTPSMAGIGDLVGYSKATISKVMSGKMPPTWRLVSKLGAALGVPDGVVGGQWRQLWLAADAYRRWATDAEPFGKTCDRCGTMVGDARTHAQWHVDQDVPATPEPYRWARLRDALGPRER